MNKLGYFLFLLFTPLFVGANVKISEIMYDLEGADGSREWIEILNTGNENVDLTGWKVFENNTNHKISLTEEGGDFIVPSGGCAVIADNPTKFLADWPSFSGVVLDSAFSLKNEGEQLVIRDSDLNDIDAVFYDPELGAGGDGNSLQVLNDEWFSAPPNPGSSNFLEGIKPVFSATKSASTESNILVEEYIQPEDRPQIRAYAGKDKIAIAGALIRFKGEAIGFKDEPIDNARYLWNFGNGALKEGKSVEYFYEYPGEYKVVLDVSLGENSISDVLIVRVVENDVFISEIKTGVDSFIEFSNPSREEINISGWFFKQGIQRFTFAKNSFIRPKSYLVIPARSSGIIFETNKGKVDLFYSGGSVADYFSYEGNLLHEQSFSRSEDSSFVSVETPGGKNGDIIVAEKVLPQKNEGPVKVEKNKIEEESPKEEAQMANVIEVVENNEKNSKWYYYFFGVVFVVLVASVAVVFVRRNCES